MIKIATMVKLNDKHTRAVTKHDWTGYSLAQMNAAAADEQVEIDQAESRGQIYGPHGIIDETYDLIAVLLRKIEALEGGPVDIATPDHTRRNSLVVRYRILLEILPLALKEAGIITDPLPIAQFIQNAIDEIDHYVPAASTDKLLTRA